jgi:hypothetical protein
MNRLLIITLFLFSLGTLIAQSVINVSGDYTYYAPSNISIEQAKQIALERARLQCLAEEFGTVVNQSNSTLIRTSDEETEVSHFSLGGTEVKGEWLGDWKKPIYQIRYDEVNECNIVYVKVFGKARAISSSKIDVSAKILCNGVTPRHEREQLYEGDQLFVSFLSPVAGYLCMYLVDEEANAYCLLPYELSSTGFARIEANRDHIFFSKQVSDTPELVDEYVMSCSHDGESNIFYIIFSPNKFTKAADESSSASLRELSYEDLQEWLLDAQSKDAEMQVIRRTIKINKLK